MVAQDIHEWNKVGGVGAAVRNLSNELAKLGHSLFAVTAGQPGQPPLKRLKDGILVFRYFQETRFKEYFENGRELGSLWDFDGPLKTYKRMFLLPEGLLDLNLRAAEFRLIDGDICNYHMLSNFGWEYYVQKFSPKSKHVITFQYPIDAEFIEHENPRLIHALQNADALVTASESYMPQLMKIYPFLKRKKITKILNPQPVPDHLKKKPKKINVLWIGRLATRKRPLRFYNLANHFPEINFIMVGTPTGGVGGDLYPKLRKMKKLPNFKLIDRQLSEDEKHNLFSKCHILANTSEGEGLSMALLEGLSYQMALLGPPEANAEGLISRFGSVAKNGDYINSLDKLLTAWGKKGRRGQKYVKKNHDPKKIARKYLSVYRKCLE